MRFSPPPRLLLMLYGIALLMALPASWALYTSLNDAAGGSLAPLQMLDGFNYTVYSDFMHKHDGVVWSAVRVGWLSAVLFAGVWAWATGGILYNFVVPFRAETFWQAGTHYVGRFLRLLVLTAVFTTAVFLVPFLVGVLLAVAFEDTFTERGLFWLGFGGFAVGGLGTLLVWCIASYAKVWLFRTDERGALRAFGQAGRFVLTNLRTTFGPYLLLMALGAGFLGLYLLFDALLTLRNWPLILLMFVLQQAIIVGRVWLKVQILKVAFRRLTVPGGAVGAVGGGRNVPATDATIDDAVGN